MFMAALFTRTKTWKRSECPSTDEWIKMMCHLDTVECYSVTKRNIRRPFAATRMQLEIFTLSQSERERQIDIPYMLNLTYGTNEPVYSWTQKSELRLPRRGNGEEWTGSLGLVDASHYIYIYIKDKSR